MARDKSDDIDIISEGRGRTAKPSTTPNKKNSVSKTLKKGAYNAIEGAEKIKHKKTWMIVGIIVLLIIVAVVVNLHTPIGLFEAIDNGFACMGKGSENPIENSFDVIDMKTSEGKLATVDASNIICRTSHGGEIFNRGHNMTTPVMCMNDQRILVYDRGGKSVTMENPRKTVFTYTADNQIYTADLAENGWSVIATDSAGYSSELVVFDKNGNKKYIWYSANGKIASTAISDNGKYVAVGLIDSNGGEVTTEIVLLNTTQTDPINRFSYVGEGIVSMDFKGGNALALLTDKVVTIKMNGEQKETKFEEGKAIAYSNSSSDGIAVVVNKYGDDRNNTIKFITGDCIEKCSIDAEFAITAVAVGDRVITAVSDERMVSFGMNGNNIGNYNCGFSPKHIAIRGKKIYYSSTSKIQNISANARN